MNPDLAMGDVLKKTGAGHLFTMFGEPDIEIKKAKGGQVTVTVATTTGTLAIAKATTAAVIPPGGPAATGPQMGLLGALVSRKGWSEEQRDAEAERVLGNRRAWGSLSKRDASKLIDAWDDRKKQPHSAGGSGWREADGPPEADPGVRRHTDAV